MRELECWLVPKGQTAGLRIPVQTDIVAAIVRHCSGGRAQEDETLLARFMAEARDNDQWLVCGCRGETDDMPVVTIVRQGQGRGAPSGCAYPDHHARRLQKKRPPHDPNCPLHNAHFTGGEEASAFRRPLPELEVLFSALRRSSGEPPEAQAFAESSFHLGQRTLSPPSLATLLWRIMHQAGLNAWTVRSRSGCAAHLDALRKAGFVFSVDPAVRLPKVLTLRADALRRVTRAIAGQSWANHPPQGYLIGFAHELDRHAFFTAGGKVEVAEPIIRPRYFENYIAGPFLVIVLLARLDGVGPIVPLRAYAQPVLSGDWLLPVDSDLERRAAHLLRRLAEEEASAGRAIRVRKPLFSMDVPGGACVPDFVIDTGGRRDRRGSIVLEVMGLSTDEYLRQKMRTHLLMQQVGPILKAGTEDIDKREEELLADLRLACRAASEAGPPQRFLEEGGRRHA